MIGSYNVNTSNEIKWIGDWKKTPPPISARERYDLWERMDQILNKVGSYWLGKKANKQLDSVGDDINVRVSLLLSLLLLAFLSLAESSILVLSFWSRSDAFENFDSSFVPCLIRSRVLLILVCQKRLCSSLILHLEAQLRFISAFFSSKSVIGSLDCIRDDCNSSILRPFVIILSELWRTRKKILRVDNFEAVLCY